MHNGKQQHQCKDCGRQFVDCVEQLAEWEKRAIMDNCPVLQRAPPRLRTMDCSQDEPPFRDLHITRSATMPTVGIDLMAMPTANPERRIAFSKRLGFPSNNEEKWRAAEVPIFSIQVSDSKSNVHPEGDTATIIRWMWIT